MGGNCRLHHHYLPLNLRDKPSPLGPESLFWVGGLGFLHPPTHILIPTLGLHEGPWFLQLPSEEAPSTSATGKIYICT